MNFEDLSGNQLVELYGSPELMGRSFLKRVASKTIKAVKKTGGVIARNQGTIATGGLLKLAPKSIQKTVNKNFTQAAAAASTGGLSLLATKQGRNIIGSTARLAQKKIIRPVSHQVANAARNPMIQKLAVNAAASFVPGGAAALTAANALKSKARSAAAPFAQAARTVQAAAPAPAVRRSHAPAPAPVAVRTRRAPSSAPVAVQDAPAPKAGLSMPMMLGIGGVGLAGILLAVSMGKKKG